MVVQQLHGALDEMDYLDFFQSRFRPQYEIEITLVTLLNDLWCTISFDDTL